MKRVIYGILVAGALALSACGSKTCQDFCDKPCNGTTADCQAGCVKLDALNKSANCAAKSDEFYSCEAGLSDADRCSATSVCQADATAWLACLSDYCTAHPSDPECH